MFDVCYHAGIKSTLCRTYFQFIRCDVDSTFAPGLRFPVAGNIHYYYYIHIIRRKIEQSIR